MTSSARLFHALTQWISFVWQAVPARLQATLLELLVGLMMNSSGQVSGAVIAVRAKLSWTAYYKAVTRGHFSWLAISRRWLELLRRLFPRATLTLAIDDTFTPRASKKAPSATCYYDHAHKANRPRFMHGQVRVAVALVLTYGGRTAAFPLLWRLQRATGNRSKLAAANVMLCVVFQWLSSATSIRLLLDAWYMKRPLLLPLIKKGVVIIGQVRRDTALYLFPNPPTKKGRGRPRIYGEKLTEKLIATYPIRQSRIHAYGKTRLFEYRCVCAKVRFLKGHLARVVWCRFQKGQKGWSKWVLLLSTDPSIPAERVIKTYGRRWWVESMFHDIKHRFGLHNAWQQSRQSLARWTTLISLAYGLPRLMALWLGPQRGAQIYPIPWRRLRPVTAGWVATGIAEYFRHIDVRVSWDRKHRKLILTRDHSWPPQKRAA